MTIDQKARDFATAAFDPWDSPFQQRFDAAEAGIYEGIEMAAKALEADAMKCDCAALEERECGCGAWCEWKSITSARAVEIVRAVKESK